MLSLKFYRGSGAELLTDMQIRCWQTTLPFIHKDNHGEKDQYYVENTHSAIVAKSSFDKAQALRARRAQHIQQPHSEYPLKSKIACGKCKSVFTRKASKRGYITWVCWRHNHHADDCPVGRIPESEIYAAFVRMYNKLRLHEGIILTPALAQLDDLSAALQRDNPAMLAVNKAIAEAAEQSCKVSQLRARGLLDESACTAKLLDINSKLTKLRRERRQLLKNENIEDVINSLHQTVDTLHAGPETLGSFDENIFTDLVEKIIAESQTCIRFRLYGGIELKEQLREVRR